MSVIAPLPRARPRDFDVVLDVVLGAVQACSTNPVIDVPSVRIGHATVWRDADRHAPAVPR